MSQNWLEIYVHVFILQVMNITKRVRVFMTHVRVVFTRYSVNMSFSREIIIPGILKKLYIMCP